MAHTAKFDLEQVQKFKEEGNDFFKKHEYRKAIESYSKAINFPKWPLKEAQLHAILLTNRAACYIQLNADLDKCIEDCTLAIQEHPTYGKAFFRRSQAHELQGKIPEAFQDMRELAKLEPHNKQAIEAAQRLLKAHEDSQDKENRKSTVYGALSILKDSKSKQEEIEEALTNLTILIRESDKGSTVVKAGGIPLLASFLFENINSNNINNNITINENFKKITKTKVATLKILNLLSSAEAASETIQQTIGIEPFLQYLKVIFENESKSSGPQHVDIDTLNCARFLLSIISRLLSTLNSVTNDTRKQVLDTYMSVMTRSRVEELQITVLNELIKMPWGDKFDANQFIDNHFGDLLFMTDQGNLKELISLALSKVISAATSGQEEEYSSLKTHGQRFFNHHMNSGVYIQQKKALCALTSLLMANVDIGIAILFKELQSIVDVIELMNPRDPSFTEFQLLTAEVLAIAAGNQAFQKAVDGNSLEELLDLLKSEDPQVQIRTATVTSKLSSGNEKLKEDFFKDKGAGELKKIIGILEGDPKKVSQSYSWAIEALSFISFNSDVKEKVIKETKIIEAIINISKNGEKTLWYGIVSTLLNLCKYLRLDEIQELQKQLQNFASGESAKKKAGPDVYDTDQYVNDRVIALIERGVIPILITMSKDEDEKNGSLRELLSEVFCHLSTVPKTRGKIMQAGALKSLISLTTLNTEKGKNWAAHAIAKIAISVDPHLAFHDQFATRIVKPLMNLLKSDDSLQQFESLMALTNICMLGEDILSLILRDKGLEEIEMCQISQNEMIQRASSELLCNLVQFGEVADLYKEEIGSERRFKMLNALSRSDDFPTAKAASGALAILSADPEICDKMMEKISVDNFLELTHDSENPELQHRGAEALKNLINSNKETAKLVAEKGGLLAILNCIKTSKSKPAKEAAEEAYETLKSLNLGTFDSVNLQKIAQ